MKTTFHKSVSSYLTNQRTLKPIKERGSFASMIQTFAYSGHHLLAERLGSTLTNIHSLQRTAEEPTDAYSNLLIQLTSSKLTLGLLRVKSKESAAQYLEQTSAPNLSREIESYVSRFRELQDLALEYASHKKQIRFFATLPEGWDTYSAKAPSKIAIGRALHLVDLAEKHALGVKWVAPSVDDSVMVLIDTQSGEQEWEFFGDGGTAAMYRDADGGKAFIDLEEADFEHFLTR